ncbi:MAG: ferrous iron transport protein B [Acutalibacteraceae bacterium]
MGLTVESVAGKASGKQIDTGESDITVLLAGAPNVGKSTVFNALTGLNQHTGNWPGKTVTNSVGFFTQNEKKIAVVDLPGTYSLLPHSEEEKVARDAICFGSADVTVAVCDATTLEKCLALVLQILEITKNVIVCINLIDQAKKKKIEIDTNKLGALLGVPVIATNARENIGLDNLRKEIINLSENKNEYSPAVIYDTAIETALSSIQSEYFPQDRFFKLRLLCGDKDFINETEKRLDMKISDDTLLEKTLSDAFELLLNKCITKEIINDSVSKSIICKAHELYIKTADVTNRDDSLDRKLDAVFTGKATGIPVMIALMALVFFITVYAANYPSELLSKGLFSLGELLRKGLYSINAPDWLILPLIDGVYRVMAWVVSVMLPPMAIFFPLFTLLEDFGYLPRMAFNLDCCFKKCHACGKQSLCMAMGFGCNAAGVVGCRIIDSPRERLIAILTNSFVPCNGRFPTIIAVISMFFVAALSSSVKNLAASGIMTAAILLSVAVTLGASYVLSRTLLKGQPSAFTLELPSYRVPKIGSVIVRSIFDRTLFVLGRAVCISAPMGLIIWLFANLKIGGVAVISMVSDFLDPLGKLMGLDGVILLAFILGFPANEIVLPITLMCYLSQGTLTELTDYASIFSVLSANGWSTVTGICFILFSLFHFPCSTTMLTIKKETGSLKYTAAAFLLPTAIGFVMCTAVNLISKAF